MKLRCIWFILFIYLFIYFLQKVNFLTIRKKSLFNETTYFNFYSKVKNSFFFFSNFWVEAKINSFYKNNFFLVKKITFPIKISWAKHILNNKIKWQKIYQHWFVFLIHQLWLENPREPNNRQIYMTSWPVAHVLWAPWTASCNPTLYLKQ